MKPPRILYIVNQGAYFLSHRLALAKAVRSLGADVHVALPDSPEGRELEELGFKVHPFRLDRKGKNPFTEAGALRAMLRIVQQVRPDLVHTLTIKPLIYGGLASRLSKVPALVQSVTGLGDVFIATGMRAAATRALVTRLYRLATNHPNGRVIVQNKDDWQLLTRTGAVNGDRLELIRGSGVSTSQFLPTAAPAGQIQVLFPARLLRTKGIREFVAAAQILGPQAARFAVAGDLDPGNPASITVKDVEAWKTEGNVAFLGWQKDIASTLAGSHIVCLPSYREGVPRSLIEAAACGRPIVTTDAPGCREIVQDGVNGFLVPVGDAAALAKALGRLIDDPDLRRDMGQAGRSLVEREFSDEVIINQTLRTYKRLLPNFRVS